MSTGEAWTAPDRAWWKGREACRCERPVKGPRYLGATKCLKCDKYIRPEGP